MEGFVVYFPKNEAKEGCRKAMLFSKKKALPRRAGTLMHITSLPSEGGVGTLGAAAYRFVDFLHASGQTVWQMSQPQAQPVFLIKSSCSLVSSPLR